MLYPKSLYIGLSHNAVAKGFAKEEALKQIDAGLDEILGPENRKDLAEEEISEELYENTLLGFRCQLEGRNGKL